MSRRSRGSNSGNQLPFGIDFHTQPAPTKAPKRRKNSSLDCKEILSPQPINFGFWRQLLRYWKIILTVLTVCSPLIYKVCEAVIVEVAKIEVLERLGFRKPPEPSAKQNKNSWKTTIEPPVLDKQKKP
ncbi:MAG: hypothetical protein H7X92_10975 [Chitinophagales bacterium]|nr:hypothetical protein [Hyphomicrobiales bacterium]